MNNLGETLSGLAPGVNGFRALEGDYNPRHGLAIYFQPPPGPSIAQPGSVLGEALASRSGLGCTLLEGIPAKIPAGAAVIGIHPDIKRLRPDLLENIPEPAAPGGYVVKIGRYALVDGADRDGLVAGIQTLAMTILRHPDPLIPAAVITDQPRRSRRGIAMELHHAEIVPALLFQIMSFSTTFKGNALKWILPADFDPGAAPNMEVVNMAAASGGMDVSVGMALLSDILAGKREIAEAWSSLRAAARFFNVDKAFLDDPCPPDAPPETARRIVESIIQGEAGLAEIAVDVRLLLRAGIDPETVEADGLAVWARVDSPQDVPETRFRGAAVPLDVPSHQCGLSSRGVEGYYAALDAARDSLGDGGSLTVSFRGLGFGHAWQNYLPGAAVGLIVGWGKPDSASLAAAGYSDLLYGDQAGNIMAIWSALSGLFPANLDAAETRRLGEIAFGAWPESPEDRALLAKIDWQKAVNDINAIARMLDVVAGKLTRNRTTLSGPYLSLQILAWLCRLAILPPEMENRRGNGQAVSIARELQKSFMEWRQYLENLQTESGLELIDMNKIDAMGTRIRFLCGDPAGAGEPGP